MRLRVVVIGAGLAGLSAARRLHEAGHEVIVLDRGRGPGGRLATRRINGAVLDHGAQFFTVRSEPFAALAARWQAAGLVDVWCHGFAGRADGYPRYRSPRGLNALAKDLAEGLDVRCSTMAFAVRHDGAVWTVHQDDGAGHRADAVVITTPVPQAVALVLPAEVSVPDGLVGWPYDPTLTLLAVLEGQATVPEPGAVQDADATFSFVSDNHRKGVSAMPALTLHVRPELSSEWWDDDRDEVHARLLERARPWLGDAKVLTSQVKRWRYATPTRIHPEPALPIEGGPGPLVLAGDAFAGPKVEGAVCSGWAAADLVLSGSPPS